MKVINVKQRSIEWFKWRSEGLTATDCSIIMKLSSYKTPYRLWQEKTGRAFPPDLSNNPNVLHGVDFEPQARDLLEKHLKDILLPVCVESTSNSIFRASLDGMTFDYRPTELKCPAASTCKSLENVNTIDDLKREVKSHYDEYWPQVQHQLLVTGMDYGYLMFFDAWNDTMKLLKVDRDDVFLAEYKEKAEHFWHENIVKDKAPAMDVDRDLYAPADSDLSLWENTSNQIIEVDEEIAALKKSLDAKKKLKNILADKLEARMGQFMQAEHSGVKITKFTVDGNVKTMSVIKELCPTLTDEEIQSVMDKHRGKKSVRRRVSTYDPNDKSRTNIPGVAEGEDLYNQLENSDLISKDETVMAYF